MCSSGVHLLPFLALAISRASLNSGLSREHVCRHVFLPAYVFLSGLGNIPITKMGGSPFSHGGMVLDVGGCPMSDLAISPAADVDADAGITGICALTSTDVLALLGKNPL